MMIVVFGDVHGNLIALEKLFKLEKDTADLFISHGDIVNYGPWTNECVNYLKNIPNCTLLKGNHEQYFIDGSYNGTNLIAQTFFKHCIANFDKNLTAEIEKYQEQIVVEDYTIKHTINNQYIFSNTDSSEIIIDKNYIIGHSHQQFFREINGFSLYNTGSIGQNREYINQSCYLKYDTKTGKVELKSYLHDIERVINQMKSGNYPKLCVDYYLSKKRR